MASVSGDKDFIVSDMAHGLHLVKGMSFFISFNTNGRVQKKDTGEPRPITDMSRPFNNSVNDYIP